jgi:hypothetical protein
LAQTTATKNINNNSNPITTRTISSQPKQQSAWWSRKKMIGLMHAKTWGSLESLSKTGPPYLIQQEAGVGAIPFGFEWRNLQSGRLAKRQWHQGQVWLAGTASISIHTE